MLKLAGSLLGLVLVAVLLMLTQMGGMSEADESQARATENMTKLVEQVNAFQVNLNDLGRKIKRIDENTN